MSEFGIVYPLWNHGDDENDLLARVIGEVGIEHITIPVIGGARSQFTLFGIHETPYFHTEGGWHFPPEHKHYAASGIRPRAARWMGQRDVLKKVCDQARAAGIDVNVRLDLAHVPFLCDHAPELSQRNAWGEAYTDWGPCLNNPAYRELVAGALNDLVRYKPDGFQLVGNRVDSLSFELVSNTYDRPFGPGFEICFCAACRQVVSDVLDAVQAARSVRAHVERFAKELRPGTCSDDLLKHLQADEMLRDYVALRVQAVERWLETLARRHPEHQFYHGPVNFDSAHIGLRGLAGFSRIEVFDPESCETSAADDTASFAAVPDGMEMGLWFAWSSGSDALVRAVSELADRGVRYFDFSELEETPPETVDWLRQAVRFARRS